MIAYYAHGQGSGHCNYANIFSKVFGRDMILMTDRKFLFDSDARVLNLPNEDTDGSEFERESFPEPFALHYAPVNIKKITNRNSLVLNTVLGNNIKFLIIDVSVEIAMLARVSSVPYAYVRLMGNRNDLPHLNAYEGATFLLAYFPEELEPNDTPPWIRKKTIYLGFLSKFPFLDAPISIPSEYTVATKPIVLKVNGFGGSRAIDFGGLNQQYDIYSIGPEDNLYKTTKINDLGVVECTRPYLAHADILVAASGLNTTSEILSLNKRFIAIEEERCFDEHQHMARALDTMGWAVRLSQYTDLAQAIRAHELLGKRVDYPNENSTLSEFHEICINLKFRADRIIEHYRFLMLQKRDIFEVGTGGKNE